MPNRNMVVSAKLSSQELGFLKSTIPGLYENRKIKRPTLSEAVRYFVMNGGRGSGGYRSTEYTSTSTEFTQYNPSTDDRPSDLLGSKSCLIFREGTSYNDLVAIDQYGQPLVGYTADGELDEIRLAPLHTLVCGITRESGKTTALEGILSRWTGKKVLVFIIKDGEEVFSSYPRVRPFMKQQSDWRYVKFDNDYS